MMTEGLKAVDDEKADEKEKEDDGDYLDEFGNIKEDTDTDKVDNKAKANDLNTEAVSNKYKNSTENKKGGEKSKNKKGNPGWKDLDNVGDPGEKKNKVKEYVKSAVKVPEISSKLMFPRSSSLNWLEQEKFLYNQRLVKEGKLGPENGNSWIFYQNFQELVLEEQEEFATFTKANFDPNPSPLCEDHKRYVTEHRSARLQRPLTLPRLWSKMKEVRMVGVDPDQSCAMVLEQTLLELGKRPRANIPNLFRGKNAIHCHSVPVQYPRLVYNFPPDPSVMPGMGVYFSFLRQQAERLKSRERRPEVNRLDGQ